MKLERKTIIVSIALITVLGFAVYASSLNGKFILDDVFLIEDNPRIKNWSHLPKIFTENIAAAAGRKWNSYRPLQMITYMIDYSLWRLDVRGYHLTNTLLHIAVALSIFWLIILLFDDWLISLFTALFFAVHPIHTGAVSYISGRADSLAALFIILCFIFYVKNVRSRSTVFYPFCLLSCILALLSRENSIILPLLLLLYHYTFKKRLKIKEFMPVLGIVLIYILLRLTALKYLLSNITYTTTLFQRIPGFFVALTDYLRLLLLPFHLHMEYGDKLFKLSEPRAIVGVLILLFLLVCALRKRENNKLIFFSISWFLITLLPSSNLYPVNAYMAEHWLYLPSIALFLIVARGLSFLYSAGNLRIAAIVSAITLLAFYSCLTGRQNSYWKEPMAFYERVLKYAPDSPRTLAALATIYDNLGRKEEAIDLFTKAQELRPNYADAYNSLARAYSSIGRNEEAIRLYQQAIEINPDYAGAYNNLGLLYTSLGRYEEAAQVYRRAIEINPDYARAYNNFAILYKRANQNEEAIALYRKAIELDPDYARSYYNLGILYYEIGRKDEAAVSFKKAIEVNPDYVRAYNNLGLVYTNIGRPDAAIALFRKAIEINPDNAETHNNLGLACQAMGRRAEAIASYQKAIEIEPDSVPAHNNLAVMYYHEKQYDLAIRHCDKVIELGDKVHPEFLKLLEPYR